MSIEAMKQALKFCEDIGDLRGPYPYVNETQIVSDSRKVLKALRQAIAEAEKIVPSDYPNSHQQERHVSYVCPNCHWSLDKQVRTHTPEDVKKIESKWVGLSDKEVKKIVDKNTSDIWCNGKGVARDVEDKLKEKNVSQS